MKICPVVPLALLLFSTASAAADYYTWKDAQGNVHFSDNRPEHLPRLKKTELHVNTAIPAGRSAPKPTEEGPDVIIIGNSKKLNGRCNTRINGILRNSRAWDSYQDETWKACRGMR